MLWWRKRPAGADADGDVEASTSASGVDSATAKRRRTGPNPEEEKELNNTQLELQLLEERCAEEQIAVQHKYDRMRQPHFARRSRLLRKIPGFWRMALTGHPANLVHPAELPALEHLQEFELRDNIDKNGSFEVVAHFGEWDLFTERSIRKQVTFLEHTGESIKAANLTPACEQAVTLLRDLRGVDGGASSSNPAASATSDQAGHGGPPRSVLGWFLSATPAPVDALAGDFGDVFRRDLWQDPIPYYIATRDAPPSASSPDAGTTVD